MPLAGSSRRVLPMGVLIPERRILRRITRAIAELEVLVLRLAVLASLAVFAYRYVTGHP